VILRILVAAVLGGLVIFAWGALAWTVMPHHDATVGVADDEIALSDTLLETLPETPGHRVYILPSLPERGADEAAKESFTERHEAGPIAMIVVDREGGPVREPMTFVTGFAFNVTAALIASMLLATARLRSYPKRVLFVALLGAFAAIAADMTYMTFLRFPTDWSLAMALDHVAGWSLAGLVIGLVVRPGGRRGPGGGG